jgi:hypothetical protein
MTSTTEGTAFTGQPFVGFERVACTKCGAPVHLRSTGWFDSYQDTYGTGGTYVHYGCLSPQRLAEIEAEKASRKKD